MTPGSTSDQKTLRSNPSGPLKRHLASANTFDLNPWPNPSEPLRTPFANPFEPLPLKGFTTRPATGITAAHTPPTGVQRGSKGFLGLSPRKARRHTARRGWHATSAPARTVTGTADLAATEPAASEMPPAPGPVGRLAAAGTDGTATGVGTSAAARRGGISPTPDTNGGNA